MKHLVSGAVILHLLVLLGCARQAEVQRPAEAGPVVRRAKIERIVASYREKMPALIGKIEGHAASSNRPRAHAWTQ